MAHASKRPEAGLRVTIRQPSPIPLDVDFACESGELLALVGPSGGGKSTVLRCIAGLHAPQHGYIQCQDTVWLDSNRGIHLSPQARRVGMVFQHFALFPHLRCVDNVTAAMSHRPREEREPAARELLARVNMGGLEKRLPPELSGGQRQRVALARALARDPVVLLLDEPFSAVDHLTRRRLHRELAELRASIHIPVILVTHDLDDARLLADAVSVLHHGVTLQTDTTRAVMRHPVSAAVARLVGHRNVFSGRVTQHDSGRCITWMEWAGLSLECLYQPEFPLGECVDWIIPHTDIIMHRRDRPSRGEHENPIHGRVSELIKMGDEAVVTLSLAGCDQPIHFVVSEHVAKRNALESGAAAAVSLLSEGIHLMWPM